MPRMRGGIRKLGHPWRRFPKAAWTLTSGLVALVLTLAGANAYILLREQGNATSSTSCSSVAP